MNEKTMNRLLGAIGEAHDDALALAADLYPRGSRVGVMLSSRQVNPSPATIRSYEVRTWNFGNGTTASIQVRVEMDNYKSQRSRFVSVSPEAIRAA